MKKNGFKKNMSFKEEFELININNMSLEEYDKFLKKIIENTKNMSILLKKIADKRINKWLQQHLSVMIIVIILIVQLNNKYIIY